MNRKLLGINSAKDLFELLQMTFSNFYKSPSSEAFFLLAFGLFHLREWIVQGQKYDDIQKVPDSQKTTEQKFFIEIYDVPEYRDIIKELCNGIKHFKLTVNTEEISGFRAGLGRAGDSLDQISYMINGKDSRDVFSTVINKYQDYFTKKS